MRRRIAVGDPEPVSVAFPSQATGQVIVDVINATGEVVVSGVAATLDGERDGAYLYRYMVGSPLTDEVGELTLEFSGTFGGTARSQRAVVDVVGDHYFEVADVRTRPSVDQFTDDQIVVVRDAVAGMIERVTGTSFVARYRRERVDGTGTNALRVTGPWVLSVIGVRVNGVDWDAADVAALDVDGRWVFDPSLRWPAGQRNVEIAYRAGYTEQPPPDLREALIDAARNALLDSLNVGASPQATTLTTEVGVITLARAGQRWPTGYPRIDAVITDWRERVVSPI